MSAAVVTRNYNAETSSDPLVSRDIHFTIRSFAFRVPLKVPRYIFDKLCSADWDRATALIRGRAESLLNAAASKGYIGEAAFPCIADLVSAYARECVYDQFCRYQERSGNEAWEVPETLQARPLIR